MVVKIMLDTPSVPKYDILIKCNQWKRENIDFTKLSQSTMGIF